jgi:hypothetical protein
MEPRNRKKQLDPGLIRTMEDFEIIHCVDLSRDDKPAYKSDILYTRIFGKGPHNIYQPSDEDLKKIDTEASNGDYDTAFINFHSMRMYKDAARLKIFKETHTFPMVTHNTGLDSLKEVLEEDAKFPTTKKALISDQGWKLIDLREDKRVQATAILKKLTERTYLSLEEVLDTLQSTMKG